MQVTQTHAEGLKREFKVVLPAADLAERLEGQLAEIKAKAQIPGFRPGKVPASYLKKLYGRSIMADVVQDAINEANRKIVEENELRVALEPKIDLPSERDEIEKVFAAESDLSFTVALEVLPEIEIGSFADIEIERLKVEVPEVEIEQAITRLAEINRPFLPKEREAAAAKGDKVTISFSGKIDGEPFAGGSAENVDAVLGSGGLLPGLEEQIEGMALGESRTIHVTFPENYSAAHLAGKPATFDVTLNALASPGAPPQGDELAKGLGFESLEALRQAIRSRIEGEYRAASRLKWKRDLLDALDVKYAFEVPEGMVAQEFETVWRNVEASQRQSGRSFEDEGTTEEAAREEYRKIARRRVKLGLLLAEVGEKAGIKITDEEIAQAIAQRARAFPGQEKAIWERYRKNPAALAEIKAPLLEEKVADYILSQVKVSEKEVAKEDLLRAASEEE
jgi:trigger factor